jgi:hypothetical protein
VAAIHPRHDKTGFLAEELMTTFSDTSSVPECAVITLSHFGLVLVQGSDRIAFLQRLLSNDLRELTASHSQLSCHCNANGRVLITMRVIHTEKGTLLIAPRTQIPLLLERFDAFKMRSHISYEDISDQFVCSGLVGSCAEANLTTFFNNAPPQQENEQCITSTGDILVRIAGVSPRWLLISSESTAQRIKEHEKTTTDLDLWALLDIRTGIATITPATMDLFAPQMINMHCFDGMSFNKGCYLGQEVIALLHYPGKLKRRLHYAQVTTTSAPQPGDLLCVDDEQAPDAKAPGTIVNACPAPNSQDHYELLVVIDDRFITSPTTLKLATTGAILSLTARPN